MTLGFSTKWPKHMGELAGQPNYFIEKIYLSIIDTEVYHNDCVFHDTPAEEFYREWHLEKFEMLWDYPEDNINAKPHTIRKGNRWKAGMKIHPVINNRTKNRFQFAPVLECVSVQDIEINYAESPFKQPYLKIGISNPLIEDIYSPSQPRYNELLNKLALNDGFPSIEAFFQYFNTDFKGQIIHWTELKY